MNIGQLKFPWMMFAKSVCLWESIELWIYHIKQRILFDAKVPIVIQERGFQRKRIYYLWWNSMLLRSSTLISIRLDLSQAEISKCGIMLSSPSFLIVFSQGLMHLWKFSTIFVSQNDLCWYTWGKQMCLCFHESMWY